MCALKDRDFLLWLSLVSICGVWFPLTKLQHKFLTISPRLEQFEIRKILAVCYRAERIAVGRNRTSASGPVSRRDDFPSAVAFFLRVFYTGARMSEPNVIAKRIGLLLVDDSDLMRTAVLRLLKTEPRIDVLGEARNFEELLKMATE